MTVLIIATGDRLHLVGDAPVQKGDRFRARTRRPSQLPRSYFTAAGVTSFTCRRTTGDAIAIRDFVYDPAIHELEDS